MASSSGPLNEELQCSICLDVFTDPVTAPCGHNFCRTCLNKHWENTAAVTYCCPSCNETFSRRPDLKINTTLTKVVQYFKKLNQDKPEVLCDICDERKQKAVKSCLTCQSSYCETHHRVQRLKKHTLINAVENLEDYICQKHERPLELFCRDDQTRVCLSCTEGDQQKKTLSSIDCFLTSSRTVHISNWMIISLGLLLVAILLTLPKQYTASDPRTFTDYSESSKAEDLCKELQHEVTQLKKSTALHISQMYSSNEKLHQTGLKWAQLFAVDVTLDPETAHPALILSDDGKQVSHGNMRQDVPENPKRFYMISVLAKQGFSSGRFYFEVQVKGKTGWSLGVARESINRKENLLTPVNGFWAVTLRKENQYKAGESPSVSLSLREKPEVVGVFVDYEEGLVSFYDVRHRSHIYSFTGQTFTDKLYPYFSPYLNEGGKNSKPLIISPVS